MFVCEKCGAWIDKGGTEKSVREKLLALVCISDKVYELYDKDISKTQNWLMTPNHLFFDFSPFHMVLGGKADVVINKLNEWYG
jgi:hypothetical protein